MDFTFYLVIFIFIIAIIFHKRDKKNNDQLFASGSLELPLNSMQSQILLRGNFSTPLVSLLCRPPFFLLSPYFFLVCPLFLRDLARPPCRPLTPPSYPPPHFFGQPLAAVALASPPRAIRHQKLSPPPNQSLTGRQKYVILIERRRVYDTKKSCESNHPI